MRPGHGGCASAAGGQLGGHGGCASAAGGQLGVRPQGCPLQVGGGVAHRVINILENLLLRGGGEGGGGEVTRGESCFVSFTTRLET